MIYCYVTLAHKTNSHFFGGKGSTKLVLFTDSNDFNRSDASVAPPAAPKNAVATCLHTQHNENMFCMGIYHFVICDLAFLFV